MSVRLDHVITAARSGAASLAAELCGYIVLGAADQVAQAPCQLQTCSIELGSEGDVRVSGGRAAEDTAAEGSLRRLLSQLLDAARSNSPALQRASRRPVGQGVAAFVGEIEAALVPVNRGAARRALARLHREAMRTPRVCEISESVGDASSQPSQWESAQLEGPATDGPGRSSYRAVERPASARHPLQVPAVHAESPGEVLSSCVSPAREEDSWATDSTDRMETGYGSLPRAAIDSPTHPGQQATRAPASVDALGPSMLPRASDNPGPMRGDGWQTYRCSAVRDGHTPKLGSIAVSVPNPDDEPQDPLSWSDGAVQVDVDDLGDETPLLHRFDANVSVSPLAVEQAAESSVEAPDADGQQPAVHQSVLPTIPAPDPAAPAAAQEAAVGFGTRTSDLETLLQGFTAAESRSVRELCRELQHIAGLEGREGQSSLPPPATTDTPA